MYDVTHEAHGFLILVCNIRKLGLALGQGYNIIVKAVKCQEILVHVYTYIATHVYKIRHHAHPVLPRGGFGLTVVGGKTFGWITCKKACIIVY